MIKPIKYQAIILLILAICVLPFPPVKGQQIHMNLAEVSRQSDLILHVFVESTESQWVNCSEGRNIVTSIHFRIRECILGDLRSNDPYLLDMPGGTVGDTTQFVSSSVSFAPGEEAILFIRKDPGFIVGGFQGKYAVMNGQVLVEGQKIKSSRFSAALKDSRNRAERIPSFLNEIKEEPKEILAESPRGVKLKSQNSTTDTYAVSGIKSNFTGTTDADADGYFEAYNFQIRVNGDAEPGPVTAYFRINCTTTGQTWTSINSYVISGSAVDFYNFGFDQSNFAGKITGNTELSFTVEMLDLTKTTVLAEDATVTGDLIKVDFVTAPTITISSISPDHQSAGTSSSVTISGVSFGATQGSGKVEFFYRDGQPKMSGNILSWSDTQIVCTVPVGSINGYSGSAGSGPVTVTNNAGQTSNGYPFRVTFGFGGPKWSTHTVPYRINENLASLTGEGQAIQNAANTWNAANADFQFQYGGSTTNVASAYNNHNDLAWGTLTGSSIIGQASIWYSGSYIIECDITFNDSYSWSASASVPGSSVDIETIAVHELGHWLNLRDLYGSANDGVYDQMKVMYGYGFYGQSKRDLHPDDAAGINWIYGQAVTLSISGYVKTDLGTGVSNVVLNGLPGNPQTNVSGYYSADLPSGWTGTVTPSKTGFTFSLPSHNYSNQTTSLTDQNFTAFPVNNDATLSDLKVSGTSISGFIKTQLNYDYQLPMGTTAVPPVTATTTNPSATKIMTPASSLPGTTTVQVTAQDGTTQKTYTINFTLAKNNDASLSNLNLSGSAVAGFQKSIHTYTIQLPFGTTAVPAVSATPTDPNATIAITPAASLPGSTTIRVTAEDRTTLVTYYIIFTLALPSGDAGLSSLRVDGVQVPGFNAGTLFYAVVLPYGSVNVPVVTATASQANATIAISPAVSLPGVTTCLVTAQDGTTKRTYTVSFTVAKNDDATLSSLTVSGAAIPGFVKTNLVYMVELPYGSTVVPPVGGSPSDTNATLVITPAASLPGVSTLQVTAENGTTTRVYSVFFTLEPVSNDARLSGLKVNGATVPGFNSSTLSYTLTLPYGTVTVPLAEATASSAYATVLISPAGSLPGTTTVEVTAQDGSTRLTYSIYFRIAKNNDASLADLRIDGTTVPGFVKTSLYYRVELPFGSTAFPVVSAETADANASQSVTQAAALPGNAVVLVTAEDGTTTETYSIAFIFAQPSADATLSGIRTDGIPIGEFSPATLSYLIVLPYGTAVVPNVEAIATHPDATLAISPALSLPGVTTIRVTAQDGSTVMNYSVFFTLAKNSDTNLTAIQMNGIPVADFHETVFYYEVILSPETPTPPGILAVPADRNATVEVILPREFPGTVVIKVTAEDGVTTGNYYVFVRFPLSGINDQTDRNSLLAYPNPNNGSFMLEYSTSSQKKIRISVTDLSGRTLIDQFWEGNGSRLNRAIRLPDNQKGAYIIRLIDESRVFYRKIIVE